MTAVRHQIGYIFLFFVLSICLPKHNSAQNISLTLGNTTTCPGSVLAVPFTITGTFNSGNVFTAQISDNTGSFTSPTNIGTLIGTSSGTLFATIPSALMGTGYRIRLVSNDPTVISSNVSGIITISGPVGNPTVFGSGQWNAYVYSGNNFDTYRGTFNTTAALNFNTSTYYATNGSPSSAAGYSGCPLVTSDNHSITFKRTNFPCGYYQINVGYNDVALELLIDGAAVGGVAGGTGGPFTNNNVWRGILGPTSTVELRIKETTGNNQASLSFVSLPLISLPATAIKCNAGSSVTLTATVPTGITLDYSWSPATNLNTTTGATVIATPPTNTTYTVTGTDPATGCTFTASIDVQIAVGTTIVSPTNVLICPGQSTTLTASGAVNYTWSPSTGLSSTSGAIVTANPTATTTYTVTGDDGCATSTATVTVNVGTASGNPTVFGNNVWNVYAYQGNIISAPASSIYLGYYTENNLSFASNNRWNLNSTPSNASGYVGCVVPADNHSVSYKRTNFTCNIYQIDLVANDNNAEIYIDGALAYSRAGSTTTTATAWTGVLGSPSQVELRWIETTGNSRGALNFTVLPLIPITDYVICPTSSATIVATNVAGMTYSWTGPGGFTANTSTITTPVGVAGAYVLTATHAATGCTFTATANVTLTLVNPVVVVTPASPTICGGQSTTLTATGATSYTWYQSTTPIFGTTPTISTTNTLTVNPAVTTTYSVIGFDGCNYSNPTLVTVTVGSGSPGDFGNGVWNVYCYNTNNFGNYYGYYVEPLLTFDTRNRWATNSRPSTASGYSGCALTSSDNFSHIHKRRNFTCGYYQIDITNYDDFYQLYIDGVLVSAQNSTCCLATNNIWRGFLGANSTVELRVRELTGSAHAGLRFTDIGSTISLTSLPVTICETSTTTLTAANLPISSVAGAPNATITWQSLSPTDISISATTGNSIVATALTTNDNTVRCTYTDPTTGCTVVRDILITIDPLPTTAVSANILTVCAGEPVILSATGANTYSWSTGATGTTITVNPTTTTTYTVSGNNNCATVDGSVTINVLNNGGLTGAEFGDGYWYAFAYNGNYISTPASATLRGYYTEKSISFNSANRWDINTNPANATLQADGSLGYTGCTVNNDNHSVVYKRTNFPCGYYTISIANHDDGYRLYVNGTLVSFNNGCCQTWPNVWSGLLNETSTVEFQWQDGSGGSSGSLSIGFSLASATTAIWTGNANNTDWFNALNWCPSYPDANTDVIIPGAGVSFMPTINANGAVCRKITVTTGATLTINGSYQLDVNEGFVNEGTFVANNSTINLMNTANNVELKSTVGSFYNLNLDKPSLNVLMTGNIQVNNILTLNQVALDLNGNSLTINNSSATAINRLGNAFIKSETNLGTNPSIICWNASTNVAAYTFPFGVSFTEYIPVTFDKKTNANSNVCISTRATGVNNLPLVPGTNMVGVSGATALHVIDRWWDISTSIDPLPLPGADVTFRYRAVENTLPSPTVNIAVQHFSNLINDWESPYNNSAAGVTTGIGAVTAVNLTKFSPHVISVEATPLPIELLYFRGKYDGLANTILDWQTLYEIDNEYFTIEHSLDNRSFKTLVNVPANKQIMSNKKYQYIDKNPTTGVHYYRLKQTDKDGTFTYSKIIAVRVGVSENYLLVNPNPNKGDKMRVFIQGEPNEERSLIITDALGRVVFSETIITNADGVFEKELHFMPTLAAGQYIISSKGNQNSLQEKIIIQ
ncbi:MAG: T9SS C-terminal target domain-containing protein [Cytophagales bacterium]|nr:MAG: T9SS C-terminal target domain-containing protein [Cytophagales bacterium]